MLILLSKHALRGGEWFETPMGARLAGFKLRL